MKETFESSIYTYKYINKLFNRWLSPPNSYSFHLACNVLLYRVRCLSPYKFLPLLHRTESGRILSAQLLQCLAQNRAHWHVAHDITLQHRLIVIYLALLPFLNEEDMKFNDKFQAKGHRFDPFKSIDTPPQDVVISANSLQCLTQQVYFQITFRPCFCV